MPHKVPLFKIYWDINDISEVLDVIKSGKQWANGQVIIDFENALAKYNNRKYAISFNSGTSALHTVLRSFNIKNGDEVIVPSFTFIATANAPLFVGAKPIFVDIEEDTLGLDPDKVIENISNKTKAILPIHYGGNPCKIKELREIADDNNIALIEDAAEAIGAFSGKKKVGTIGDAAVLSFCQNKIITTGEGGAVLTDSSRVTDQLKLTRSHGRIESTDYFSSSDSADYIDMGYNFRMSSITAALGNSQLQKIDEIIDMRVENARYYLNALDELSDTIKLPLPRVGDTHVYQMFTIRLLQGQQFRDDIVRYLGRQGIGIKIYFQPAHETTFYKKKYRDIHLPVTEKISSEVLSIPIYPHITKDEMDFVIFHLKKSIKEVIN